MKVRFVGLLGILACLFFSTGCATVTGSGSNQSISVETLGKDGSEVEGARCDMTNDEGTWFVKTPGSTVVHRSNKDLEVICQKEGMDVGSAHVVSRTKGNIYGNIILGGGIGAIIDHNNGTAYEYPGLIKIFMGKYNGKIDYKSLQATAAPKEDTGLASKSKENETLHQKNSASERLKKLQGLLDSGLISQQDYEVKKKEILKGM